MSGAEIAGLILGGFPLIISALEHYREGFEPLQEWWKFESEFGNFIEELGTQQARFDMNLEKLLAPFVTSDAQMNALLNERSPDAWKDSHLKKELRSRLGNSYEWYIAICRKMNATLEALEERLGIVDGQVKYVDATKWDHELRRLRISFSRKKFKHVKLLTKYNEELQQLLSSSDELAPSRRRRRKTPLITLLRTLQVHSQSLHSALLDGWKCQCPRPHEAKLQLERRTAEDDSNELRLHLLFEASSVRKPIEVRIWDESTLQSADHSIPVTPGENFLELKQQLLAKSAKADTSSATAPASNAAVSIQKSSILRTTLAATSKSDASIWNSFTPHRSKKKAQFAEISATVQAEAKLSQPLPQVARIKNICSELPTWNSTTGCIGFIPAAPKSRLFFYPDILQSDLHEKCETVTLEELLSLKISQGSSAEEMSRYQRFTLANILALAVLQLQPTSWLTSTWTKRDIVFLHPCSKPMPLLSHPYISKQFPPSASKSTASTGDCKNSLFCLGILLLELTFNQRLETLPIRQKYLGPDGSPNEYTDLCTAKDWHRKVEGECGEGLSEAIRRCIDCSFGPKPDWNSGEFAEAYFGNVMEPLRELLRQWEGNT